MHGGYAHDLVFYFLQKENKSANGQPFSRQQCEYGEKRRAYVIAYKKCKQKISRYFSKTLSHCRCKYTL